MASSLIYDLDLDPQSKWYTIAATPLARSSLLYAQEIGNFFAGSQYNTSREAFPSYLLKLSLDGCGVLEYGGQRYQVPAGHFFWVDCSKPQTYYTDSSEESWHVVWLHFYGGSAKSYYDAFLSVNEGSPVASLPINSNAYTLFRELLEVAASEEEQLRADFEIARLITNLLTECIQASMGTKESRSVPQIIHATMLYLQENYMKRHTLESLGTRFNINPFYLQKQFKRYVGQSPTDYCIYLRINRAKVLMRSTYATIGEISREVGIENLGYFTRLFKQHEGITPQAYRELWPVLQTGVRPQISHNHQTTI